MRHAVVAAALVAAVLGACGREPDSTAVDDLPEAVTGELLGAIQEAGRPAVVNVWASWCGPCRSEAPLLAAAADTYAGTVDFIGLNVRDSQSGAKGFIAEFLAGAPIRYLFDADGSVVADLGGSGGVPLTFFMDAAGDVNTIHFGVIDERSLAFEIDELLRLD